LQEKVRDQNKGNLVRSRPCGLEGLNREDWLKGERSSIQVTERGPKSKLWDSEKGQVPKKEGETDHHAKMAGQVARLQIPRRGRGETQGKSSTKHAKKLGPSYRGGRSNGCSNQKTGRTDFTLKSSIGGENLKTEVSEQRLDSECGDLKSSKGSGECLVRVPPHKKGKKKDALYGLRAGRGTQTQKQEDRP